MAEVAAKGSVLSPYGRRSTGVSWRKRSPLCVGFPHSSPSLGIDPWGRGSSCNSGGFHGGTLVLGDRRGKTREQDSRFLPCTDESSAYCESLRSLTSLQSLTIWDCGDLERIEDWRLGVLTDLQSFNIGWCKSHHYLPAHK